MGKGGKANSASSQKTCWVCGKAGHLSKDCKNRVGAVTEGSGTAPSAARRWRTRVWTGPTSASSWM